MNIPDPIALDRILTALEAIKAGPSDEDLMTAPTLDFWKAVIADDVPRLIGIAIGHPNFPRSEVYTSMLMFVSKDRSYARTLSRWYRLGPKNESNRVRLDWTQQKRLNLKALASHRQKLRADVRVAALKIGDDRLIERAAALGFGVSRGWP